MAGREIGVQTVKCALTNISPRRLLFGTEAPTEHGWIWATWQTSITMSPIHYHHSCGYCKKNLENLRFAPAGRGSIKGGKADGRRRGTEDATARLSKMSREIRVTGVSGPSTIRHPPEKRTRKGL